MKPKTFRKRLDLLLLERGFAGSPQKALAMILAGEVQVDGQRAEKAGMPVAEDARIEVISRTQKFVSRGGTKLEGALQDFAIKPADCDCLEAAAESPRSSHPAKRERASRGRPSRKRRHRSD